MKFTIEEAFENLKGHLTNNGKKTLRMSEDSLRKQLETLVPIVVNDEMELSDFVAKTKTIFETTNSNVEHDNSKFVNQWKVDHPEKPLDKGGDTPPANPSEPDPQLAAMQAELDSLKTKLEAADKAKAIDNKAKELDKAMLNKGIKDAEWRQSMLKEIVISEDMDIEAKASSFLNLYNKANAIVPHGGATPQNPKGGNPNNNGSGMFDYIKKDYDRNHKDDK